MRLKCEHEGGYSAWMPLLLSQAGLIVIWLFVCLISWTKSSLVHKSWSSFQANKEKWQMMILHYSYIIHTHTHIYNIINAYILMAHIICTYTVIWKYCMLVTSENNSLVSSWLKNIYDPVLSLIKLCWCKLVGKLFLTQSQVFNGSMKITDVCILSEIWTTPPTTTATVMLK